MDLETIQTNVFAKLPLLKQGEYEMWRLRIEQYFQIQDYALWDIIKNGNSFNPVARTTTNADGTSTLTIPGPVTTEQKVQKKNDVKARMVWRNKPDLDSMSFDDLYNNFKIVEQEVKRTVTTSSNSGSQNVAFVSTPSSTNEVNTANVQVSTDNTLDSTANLSDATHMCTDEPFLERFAMRAILAELIVTDDSPLFPCVASTCSRSTMKTDIVKHDVEVESLGECVDEIDKLTEVSMKQIQIGSMQVFWTNLTSVTNLLTLIRLEPQVVLCNNDSPFFWKALENDVYCFDVTISLNGFSGSQFNIFLKPCCSIHKRLKGSNEWSLFKQSRIILP
ncbi:hypothetical protein Tco_0669753 [Tanacetum coccineum]